MNTIKEKSKDAFNRQAETYDHDLKGQHVRANYPLILQHLSKISYNSVLDLGCGTGELLFLILKNDLSKQAYGIDISENMLSVAEKKLKGSAKLVQGDSENLPYESDFFDIIYCNDSFHHYPVPKNVLLEVYRVLKPGGTFILCDAWQPFLSRKIMNLFMKNSSEGDVKIYSIKEINNLLSPEFCNISYEKINHTACIYTAIK